MTTIVGIYCVPDTSEEDYPALIHDHNLAIYRNKNLDKYLHLERSTRKKHHAQLQHHLDDYAKELKLIPANNTTFVFVDHEIGRAAISGSGAIRFEAPLNDKPEDFLEKARLYWFGEWKEAYALNHELAHVLSCVPFYGIFKENSLMVHFDGGASKSNFSAWKYTNGNIELLEYHYKLKWLSSLFNANALVFALVKANRKEQNTVPGKFMGLASYGNYNTKIETWLQKNNFFENCWGSKASFFISAKNEFGKDVHHIDNKNPFIQNVAATIHEIFVRETLKTFARLKEITNADFLYFSGGSALNIKLNARLLQSGFFKEVYIPPCTNDSGLSLGAITAGAMLKNLPLPEAGPYLNNHQLVNSASEYSQDDIAAVANRIVASEVIGLCNGYGEAGPRALGNRSIIARADNKKLAQKVSMQYKQREWYRPIAPVMLLHNFTYFTGHEKAPVIAKYMLSEFSILDHRKNELAGCVHIDGTSRIQVIEKRSDNPYLFDLLEILDKDFKVRALVNTSFNRKGEPIVQTHQEVVSAGKEMGLDAVVLDGKPKFL
jgi:carbamoyltransferase